MKRFTSASLIFLCLIVASDLNAQALTKYLVIVDSDSLGKEKGVIQDVDADGLTIKNRKGDVIKFSSAQLNRVRVYRQHLSFGKSLLVGTVSGAAISSLAFLSDVGDAQVAVFLISTGAGILAGTIYKLGSRPFMRELKFRVHKDTNLYKRDYHQLVPFIHAADQPHL